MVRLMEEEKFHLSWNDLLTIGIILTALIGTIIIVLVLLTVSWKDIVTWLS